MPDVYCMYLRKSRKDIEAEQRGDGETLARHRAALEALAARNRHHIGKTYQEIVSGESIADRPEMQHMLDDVQAGMWQGVYVMEVERLARGDTSDQGRVAKTFMFSHTQIITPQKTYNPEDEFDAEYFEFSLFMSRREYKTINRRIQAGRMASVREGKYICSRPAYGYRKVKIQRDKGYTLEIKDDEAEVVRYVFGLYRDTDMGITRIANHLADLKTPVGEQGSVWTACRIYRMLTNEVYIGQIRWGKVKTQRELVAGDVHKRLVTRQDYELHAGMHPAIIDDDLFAEVQRKLHVPRSVPKNDGTLSNPLSGLLVCSECGKHLRGVPAFGRQPAQVFCATRGCPTVRTYRGPVEQAILDVLRDWLRSAQVQSGAAAAQVATQQSALAALESERDKTQKQIGKLQDLLEQGVYTVSQYTERYAVLTARVKDIDEASAKARAKERTEYMRLSDLAPQIHSLLDLYEQSTPAEKNAMLKACISKVVYTKKVRGQNQFGRVKEQSDQFELDVFPRFLRW